MVVVVGEDRANYLDIVAHALGEQGPDGPVDETARQDGSFGRSAFPAEEGAGNAAGGIQPLLKIQIGRASCRERGQVGGRGGAGTEAGEGGTQRRWNQATTETRAPPP